MDNIGKLKKIIMSLIIIIIVIIIVLIIFYKKENTGELIPDEATGEIILKEEVDTLKDHNTYYSVINAVAKFYNYIYEKDSDAVYGLLDKEYINKKQLTLDNVLNKMETYDEETKVRANKIYNKQGYIYNMYYFEGYVNDTDNIYIIVNVDYSSGAFSIEILNKESFNNAVLGDNKIEERELIKNEYNKFAFINIPESTIVMDLFENMKYKLMNYPNEAFELLDKEYRNKRFQNLENYKKYLEDNKKQIENWVISKYSVTRKDDYIEYICVDIYENYYTIKETAVMEYTIMLDNYTLQTEEYEEEYSKLDENKKVSINLNKFITMINTKNYEAAYNLLDGNFRRNNFNNRLNFENYIKTNFYDNNILNITNIKEEGNVFVCSIVIKSSNALAAESQEKEFILKLNEGTDFVLSFDLL